MNWKLPLLVALVTAIIMPEVWAQTFEQRVTVEPVRKRINRIKGGDWDDKLDRISFDVKFTNGDPTLSFENCKAQLFIFAQSVMDRKAYQLLGSDTASFSLPPRGTFTFETKEVSTRYDTTNAKFGAKYDSYILLVHDSAGKLLLKKSSNPQWLPNAEKIAGLKINSFYDFALAEVKVEK